MHNKGLPISSRKSYKQKTAQILLPKVPRFLVIKKLYIKCGIPIYQRGPCHVPV